MIRDTRRGENCVSYIAIGHRRLFVAIAISTGATESLHFPLSYVDDVRMLVTIGPVPSIRLPVLGPNQDEFILRGESGHVQGTIDIRELKEDPDICYVEVIAYKRVAIDDDKLEAFNRGSKDVDNELAPVAEALLEITRPASALLAATLGLRLHRQLVLKPLSEAPLVYSDKRAYSWPDTSMFVVVDSLTLLPESLATLIVVPEHVTDPNLREHCERVLSWLLEVWQERSVEKRFLALFICLEVLLEKFTTDQVPPRPPEAAKIKTLIRRSASPEERNALLSYFDKTVNRSLPNPNTLAGCFVRMAEQADFDTKAHDIEMFNVYRTKRNLLMHEGENVRSMGRAVNIESRSEMLTLKAESGDFEKMIIRYLCWWLFPDHAVYPGVFHDA